MRSSRILAGGLVTSMMWAAACSSSPEGGGELPDASSSGGGGELPGSSSGDGGSSSGGPGGGSSGGPGSSSGDGASSGTAPPSPTHSDGVKNGDETDVDCGGATAPRCADGQQCGAGADCVSVSCVDSVCAEPTHSDGVKNGDETDVDCGGATAPRCGSGLVCSAGNDCSEGVCVESLCAEPTHSDGVKNGDETGLDCGGPTAPNACPPGQGCAVATDCLARVCVESVCVAATATDGVKNGDETDVDCGGSSGRTCAVGLLCAVSADCTEGVCGGDGTCAAPARNDGVKNGNETDVDCGASAPSAHDTNAPVCADAKVCLADADCHSGRCSEGRCAVPSRTDGVKNGNETDVDCGSGPLVNDPVYGATVDTGASKCADAKACVGDDDCVHNVCHALTCRPTTESYGDGRKNGDESDVDCGGSVVNDAQRCRSGKVCAADSDCRSEGCNYNHVCAKRRSCTQRFGGDTCGTGGDGGVGAANWEDCCATAPVTVPQQANATVQLGKYQVTAGRMRVFLEAINYDVRGFVQQARAAGKIPNIPAVTGQGNSSANKVLEAAWDLYLPVSFLGNQNAGELTDTNQSGASVPGLYTSIYNHLGGFIFKNNAQSQTGCFVGAPGTHTFRFPDNQQDGQAPNAGFDVYDTKALSCPTYLVAQAFCVWDGGRLETVAEWYNAIGPANFPWGASPAPRGIGSASWQGCRFPRARDAVHNECGLSWASIDSGTESIELANSNYSYEWPQSNGIDYMSFISAPGRTRGRGPSGHADLAFSLFELTSDVAYNANPFSATKQWTYNGSWEGHGYSKNVNGYGRSNLLSKYGKAGLRCSYPSDLDN